MTSCFSIPGLYQHHERIVEEDTKQESLCYLKADKDLVNELRKEYPQYDFLMLCDGHQLLRQFSHLLPHQRKKSIQMVKNSRADLQLNRLALRRIGDTYMHQLKSFEEFTNMFEFKAIPSDHPKKVRQEIQSWLHHQYELMVINMEEKLKKALSSIAQRSTPPPPPPPLPTTLPPTMSPPSFLSSSPSSNFKNSFSSDYHQKKSPKNIPRPVKVESVSSDDDDDDEYKPNGTSSRLSPRSRKRSPQKKKKKKKKREPSTSPDSPSGKSKIKKKVSQGQYNKRGWRLNAPNECVPFFIFWLIDHFDRPRPPTTWVYQHMDHFNINARHRNSVLKFFANQRHRVWIPALKRTLEEAGWSTDTSQIKEVKDDIRGSLSRVMVQRFQTIFQQELYYRHPYLKDFNKEELLKNHLVTSS